MIDCRFQKSNIKQVLMAASDHFIKFCISVKCFLGKYDADFCPEFYITPLYFKRQPLKCDIKFARVSFVPDVILRIYTWLTFRFYSWRNIALTYSFWRNFVLERFCFRFRNLSDVNKSYSFSHSQMTLKKEVSRCTQKGIAVT